MAATPQQLKALAKGRATAARNRAAKAAGAAPAKPKAKPKAKARPKAAHEVYPHSYPLGAQDPSYKRLLQAERKIKALETERQAKVEKKPKKKRKVLTIAKANEHLANAGYPLRIAIFGHGEGFRIYNGAGKWATLQTFATVKQAFEFIKAFA